MDKAIGSDWPNYLFVATHGYVVALDRRDGTEVWRTNLRGTGWGPVTLLVDEGIVFAATKGQVFALHPATGEVFWRKKLAGLGYSWASLATARGAVVPGGGSAPPDPPSRGGAPASTP